MLIPDVKTENNKGTAKTTKQYSLNTIIHYHYEVTWRRSRAAGLSDRSIRLKAYGTPKPITQLRGRMATITLSSISVIKKKKQKYDIWVTK